MGLAETIGKIMMKLVPGAQKAMQEYENNMTLEQIEDLEKQGCDMTEYRRKYFERKEQEGKDQQRLIDESLASLDYGKLEQYKLTPRKEDSEFVQEVMRINTTPLFGKKRWQSRIQEAPIVYCGIVQAHSALFTPGNEPNTGMVLVFSLNPKNMYNAEWLDETAKKIREMKNSNNIPTDCVKFITTLRDDQSIFCFPLGKSISEDEGGWCVTFSLDYQKFLPNTYIPANRILPFLVLDTPKENVISQLELIPSKFYTK